MSCSGFFVLFFSVKLKSVRPTAVSIAAAVILAVGFCALLRPEFVERLERITYDFRLRATSRFAAPAATNLGFVFISDDSIAAVNDGSLDYRYGLYWPRHVYGRLLRELSAQSARAVAFDIVFPQLRPDHAAVRVPTAQFPDLPGFLRSLYPNSEPTTFKDGKGDWSLVESDDFFAWQLKRSRIAILAGERNVRPHPLFATNAAACADIFAFRDSDGVLRRARVFQEYHIWHPALVQVESEGWRLRLEPGWIIASREGEDHKRIRIDANNHFDLADIVGGASRKVQAFTVERVWHMGVQLAARALGLDLERAQVELASGRVTLVGSNGTERVIPVDADGYMLINWGLSVHSDLLTTEPIEFLLRQDRDRAQGLFEGTTNRWRDKLVVVGSAAVGNDLTDIGATPLEKDTLLVSKHWNVANSIITNRFIRRSSVRVDLAVVIGLGMLTAFMTWRLRGFAASAGFFSLMGLYVAVCYWLFIRESYWLSLVLPTCGALLLQYLLLVTFRVVFEERERRRTKSVFSKLVAPEIVNELLKSQDVAFGGERRIVTVLFADVRGFTELTDRAEERANELIQTRQLSGMQAEECHNALARETLEAVNLYLSTVSTLVKRHHGVLDKYIGDCVMAFWGAPMAYELHATAAVHMAIEAQRAIFELNQDRERKNRAIEIENRARASAGLPLRSPLPLLSLGTGINTGSVTVGLMGSNEHGLNYTVFGREVNLASRLESVSGRGRIVIGENTLLALRRDDPALASRCRELEAVTLKGFHRPVRIFEVPWQ